MVSPSRSKDGEPSTTKKSHDDFTRALASQAIQALAEYEKDPDLLGKRREDRNLSASPERPGPQFSALNLEVIEYAGALDAILAEEKKIYQEHEAALGRTVTIKDVMEYEQRTAYGADPYKECASVGRPIARLGTEADIEAQRIKMFEETDDRCNATTKKELDEMDSLDRRAMARHFVRQRWEMMRIWNDRWKLTTSPKPNWTWPWQKARPDQDEAGNLTLLRDAIDACGALSPGEYGAQVQHRARNQKPRSDWTATQGDDFLGSRPWFVFDAECMVEWTRRGGVALDDQQRWPTAPGDFVRRRWMERGLWRREWDYLEGTRSEPIPGWRWKGEGEGKGKDEGGDEPGWADLEELRWIKDTLRTLKMADRVVKDGDPVPKRSRRIVERQAGKRRATEEEAAKSAAVQESAAVVPQPRRGRGASQQPVLQPPSQPHPAGRRGQGRGASQQPVTQPPAPAPAAGRRGRERGRGRREASQQPAPPAPPPTRTQPAREWKGKRRADIKEEEDEATDPKSAAPAPARKRRRRR
ncbi:hypothetical protein ISF_05444 [Cordyceps fumosorosea ARSEF 2679]|uniref:Uncharacterized protein n=1 Tax=Cordyceps fumosorosea (strain ARSEF 2679) TaxID=1081104 RepID=A0A167U9U7_CORFA|nr:hypothetical protein ISF_05444 [Cordyceps fumosorosea ARSEF 2679]OAA61365.1 hypothetical protein ISF_05444 [Cordyceps fumosorosea ARSEF 2679]